MTNKTTLSKDNSISRSDNAFIKNTSYICITGIILTLLSLLFDKSLLVFVEYLKNNLLITIFSIITYLGEIKEFIILAIILTIIFFIFKKPVLAFWMSIGLSSAAGFILKYIISRPRPFEYLHTTSIVQTSFSSFPSGHALAVFCILPFVAHEFPRGKIFFWSIAVLVGLSRIYLQVHYLSDVVAGAFIGYIIGSVLLYLSKKHGWR